MTYGSLFSGCGGADLGFDAAGLKCRWQVEIDKHARSVLDYRWPDVEKYPDVCGGGKHNLAPVDVIVGGSPCQSFSVAGKREGMEGTSDIFREMVRVCGELQPRFILWENVPGVFSGFDEVPDATDPDGGRDALAGGGSQSLFACWMGTVLRAFSDLGYGGAWRIIDAKHFGVPQRRRRVFAVFARGIGGDSGSRVASEILAFPEGLRRDHPPRGEAGEGVAGTLANCLRASGVGSERIGDTRGQDTVVVCPAVTSKWAKGSGGPAGDECQNLVAHTLRAEGFDASDPSSHLLSVPAPTAVAGTLGASGSGTARPGRGNGNDLDLLVSQRQVVRRITPREAERLMGFPDDHTRWGLVKGEVVELADGPRYKLCGNAVVSTKAEWIGHRLMNMEALK